MIVTSADVGLALHCRYDLKNTTVSNSLQSGLEVKGAIEAEYFEETIVASPNVTMIVSDVAGQDIFFAQVRLNCCYIVSFRIYYLSQRFFFRKKTNKTKTR